MAAIEPDRGLNEVEIQSGDSTVRVGDVASLLDGSAGSPTGSSLDGAVSPGIAENAGNTVGVTIDDGVGAPGIEEDVEIRTVRRARSAQGDSRWDDFGAIEMMIARVGRG